MEGDRKNSRSAKKSARRQQAQTGGQQGGTSARRRHNWWWRTGVTVAGLLVLASGTFMGYATEQLRATTPPGGSPSAMKRAITSAVQNIGEAVSGLKHPVNILLIANNARNATGPLSLGTAAGQADILMIARVDPQQHVVTLISVPRDTLIAYPGWNIPIPKIKTSLTLGLQQSPLDGPAMAMKYVSRMTGLPIQDYVITDFQGFVDAINAIDGIPVTVRHRLYDPGHSGADISAGWHMLNGEQALAFVRVRQNQAGNNYRTNDFERQQAEMEVLQILKGRLLGSTTNPAKVLRLIHTWKQDVVTNLTTEQLLGIGMETAGSSMKTVQLGGDHDSMVLTSAPLPGVNAENYLTGAYYDVLDSATIQSRLAPYGSTGSSLGLPALPAPSTVPVWVYGSAAVAANLRQQGFQVVYQGGASATSSETVYYPPGDIAWGWVVGRALGNGNELVSPGSANSQAVVVDAP